MKTTSKDGTQIAYDKSGKGPALILVGGAFSYRENGSTKELVKLLGEYFTVYDYDRRGRGESTDASTYPYTASREAEDLEAVAATTGEEPFVCAFSSGCGVVLQAIERGQKFRKVVLYEPPFVAIHPKDELPLEEVKRTIENSVAAGKRAKAVRYFLRKVVGMPALIIFLFRLLNRSAWKKNERVAHTLMYDLAVMGNLAFPSGLASGNVAPVLVMGGEKSPERLANAVKNVAKQVPHSEIRFLKDQTHSVSMHVLAPELIRFYLGK